MMLFQKQLSLNTITSEKLHCMKQSSVGLLCNLWLSICFLLLAAPVCAVMPDFHDELGISTDRAQPDFSTVDTIDPFTGKLTLVHTDISIPGNGGLDLVVQRVYNNIRNQDDYGSPGNLGLGWNFHFGRVVVPLGSDICGGTLLWSYDNAAFETPDGHRQQLVERPASSGSGFLTRDRFWGECSNNTWTIKSTAGITYIADYHPVVTDNNVAEYFVTKILDPRGNEITIEYRADSSTENPTNPFPTGKAFINKVTTSDNRTIDFTYFNKQTLNDDVLSTAVATNPVLLLKEIKSNNRVRRFAYENSEDYYSYNQEKFQLLSVKRSDGTSWEYTYYPEFQIQSGNQTEPGSYSMHTVKTPYRGKITYTYDSVQLGQEALYTQVVNTRATNTTRSESKDGTWRYTYQASSTGNTTTIDFPGDKTQVYKFFGTKSVANEEVWKIGLPKSVQITGGGANELTVFTWDKQLVSYQRYKNPLRPVIQDNAYYAPILTNRVITREGSTYSTAYSNHDEFGNPQKIDEVGPNSSARNRTLTYYNDETAWIIGQVEDDIISGIGTIHREYYPNGHYSNGLLKSVDEFGKFSSYTYYSDGNLKTATNPNGNTTNYSNYYRGLAKKIEQPYISDISGRPTIIKTLDYFGNTRSVTDARGNKTIINFDQLDRITKIDYAPPRPGTSDPNITDKNINARIGGTKIFGQRIKQGGLTTVINSDGFGRTTWRKVWGSGSSQILYERFKYDADGNMTFESQQSSSSQPNTGVTLAYDALGRITKRTEANGASTKIDYQANNVQKITNSRGHVTMQIYRSFGNPNERYLTNSTTNVTVYNSNGTTSTQNHTTNIVRDDLGLVHSVSQGGIAHGFTYDSRLLLKSETRPETGTTRYVRDDNGNIKEKFLNDGQSDEHRITYTYNALNWLKSTNFPDGSKISRTYDGKGNLKNLSYKGVTRSFEFNQVDLVDTATLSIPGGPSLELVYEYNNMGDVNSLTYPTGFRVELAPDDIGRTSQVGDFIDFVDYYPSGLLDSFTYANGVTTEVDQHTREWVSGITTTNSSGVEIVNLDYQYDNEGNPTLLKNNIPSLYEYSSTMGYDQLNRLVKVKFLYDDGVDNFLTYDNSGNLRYKSNPRETVNYTYAGSNKLLGATFNMQGGGSEQLSYEYENPYKSVTGDGFNNFTYDDANFLTQVSGATSITNSYDGEGKKVSTNKDGKASFYLYSADKLLFEYHETEDWLKEYYFLDNNLVAARKVNDPANYDSDGDGVSDLTEMGVAQ